MNPLLHIPGLPDLQTSRQQVRERQEELSRLSRLHPRVHNLAPLLDATLLFVAGASLRVRAAAGVDGEHPRSYLRHLSQNIHRIIQEVKNKSYQPDPARRVSIPKDDGTERHLGIPTVRDKHLQRGAQILLEAVYEPHFYPHSYGFRPHRSARQAIQIFLDWMTVHDGAHVLEIDLSKFFDTIPHDQLMDVMSKRISDRAILRLLWSWLKAGVVVDGNRATSDRGTPQGAAISPLLANVHLDEALDQWFTKVYSLTLNGESFLVRYADDFVLAFTDPGDAAQAQHDITHRLEQFGLTVNLKKTRLTDLRKPLAPQDGPAPEVNFLGITYYWKHCPVNGWHLALRTSDKSIRRFSERLTSWITTAGDILPEELDTHIQSMINGHRGYFSWEGNEEAISYVEHLALGARDQALAPEGRSHMNHNGTVPDPRRVRTRIRHTTTQTSTTRTTSASICIS